MSSMALHILSTYKINLFSHITYTLCYRYVKFTVMNKENDYWKGIMVGFAISTIVWCLLWSFVVGKIDRVHKQELDYIIEKHQTK
jgi:hypothetical protein